ncbi:XrtA/PEP-CTERM system-associated ATPase [uncultured Novosphingobium sp.]|uniref:XrtA/PEP-CTERM system-associated ATPase n=1 Tax=uncultured Novosphingobium sp. TaxID=292277 RepID=UPI00259433E2|nr:XrtA/PEP-CTERM system-associated ATPase [uncultured Novosphingobium sp.]
MFEDFYGLRARPFQLTPDPAFYFESATHRKALSYLGYGLAQGEGFVVITGEVGAGKSTLVAHLMATIDPARLTAALVVTSALDGEQIVHVVAQAFGLAVEGHDKASALGAIESFLHAEARAGRRCLLIVDEAQNLSVAAIEELRMLSNFQLGAHPLLQTLLLGQPEFRQLLLESDQLEQLRQRVIATHHLTAMTAEEVRGYIEHRLACAGWQGSPSFDEAVHARIHAATGGIPRRINQVLNRLLLLGAVEQRSRIEVAMLEEVLGELDDDGAIALVAPQARAAQPLQPVPVATVAEQVAQAPAGADPDATAAAAAAAMIEAALAHRDAQIDELQQAVLEVAASAEHARRVASESGASAHDGALASALQEQLVDARAHIARLEARIEEQEATLRHMLTMLIEWFEGGEQRAAA